MSNDFASLMIQFEANITAVLIISTAITGGLLMIIYIARCCKHKVAIEEATVVHCFLMAAGIIGGILLTVTVSLGAIIPELAELRHTVHEFDSYVLIGAVMIVFVFCKQARTHIFFDAPAKRNSDKKNAKKV
ncbi:MAG: hypothetical protein U1F76_01000 [Candidatus Competibacteraceae bacterium]